METIRLTSTASQGDTGCSCTYTNRSTTPHCSQHLFLHTNQTKSDPSSIWEVLRSLGKAALLLHGAVSSAGGSCSETSSPPFAITPAPPPPTFTTDLLWNTSPKHPGLVISSQHQELSTAALICVPGHSCVRAGRRTNVLGWGTTIGEMIPLLPCRQPGPAEEALPTTAPPAAGGGQSLTFSFPQGKCYFGVTPYQTVLAGRPRFCRQPGWIQPCPTRLLDEHFRPV